jgi:hypothetical protein
VYLWLDIDAKRETRLTCRKVGGVVDGLVVSVALHDGLAERDFRMTAWAGAMRTRRFLERLRALQKLAFTWEPAPFMCAYLASALSRKAHECLRSVEVRVPTGLRRIGPDMSLCLAAFPGAKVGELASGRNCAVRAEPPPPNLKPTLTVLPPPFL